MPVVASVATAALALTLHAAPATADASVWDHLADCESGEWDANADPIEGTARWDTTAHRTFQGGLQFHPRTWDWLAPNHYPDDAHEATREQQIAVAERVLDKQGWRAWPVCSLKLGLR